MVVTAVTARTVAMDLDRMEAMVVMDPMEATVVTATMHEGQVARRRPIITM
jgi:hypothetical protein